MTLGRIFKYAILAGLVFVVYKGMKYYAVYRFANIATYECGGSMDDINELKKRNPSDEDLRQFMHDTYSCVRDHQNLFDKYFFKIPENWVNPQPGSVTRKQFDEKIFNQ